MVPCGLSGHKPCIVNSGSHTVHLHVLNLYIFFKCLVISSFLQDCLCTFACILYMASFLLVLFQK